MIWGTLALQDSSRKRPRPPVFTGGQMLAPCSDPRPLLNCEEGRGPFAAVRAGREGGDPNWLGYLGSGLEAHPTTPIICRQLVGSPN